MEVKLILNGHLLNKLMCVKIIKTHTKKRLLESKKLMEVLVSSGKVFFHLHKDSNVINFTSDVRENLEDVVVDIKSFNRKKKLIQLGIGNEDTYKDFILGKINWQNRDEMENVFGIALGLMTIEQLKKMVEAYESNI
jgi:hypothetical protein